MRTPIRSLSLFATTLALAALQVGCATPASREASYEQALSQWQGASEEQLTARWGKPISEQQTDGGRWLTYIVNNGVTPAPSVGFSIGGFGFGGGGHSGGGLGVGVGGAVPVGAATPLNCTTRFLIANGKVSTWNFDGPGCGAAG